MVNAYGRVISWECMMWSWISCWTKPTYKMSSQIVSILWQFKCLPYTYVIYHIVMFDGIEFIVRVVGIIGFIFHHGSEKYSFIGIFEFVDGLASSKHRRNNVPSFGPKVEEFLMWSGLVSIKIAVFAVPRSSRYIVKLTNEMFWASFIEDTVHIAA